MPFIAIRKATGERIDITTIENTRAALISGECLCQLCDTPMIVKAGLVRQHHFAHVGRCSSDYQSHPESPAHQEAKRYLATHLREWFGEYAHTHIAYEVPIPEVRRIADLLVTFPTGWRVAHEVQLASITSEQLQERTNDYILAGIDVVWWLGKSADTEVNRAWCRCTFGYALSLTVYE
jgi:competence CoiA-like predicted nuclease